MKKKLIVAAALLATTAFTGSAFAAVTIEAPDSTTEIGGAAFVPSTGVTVKAIATNTAYAAQSKHMSGNKQYGTTSTMSDIKAVDDAIGDVTDAPSSATALSI